MVRKLAALVIAGAFAVSLSSASVAQDKKKAKPGPMCPACKMELASKKDATNTVAIKAGKKTVYCCTGCDMKDWKKDKKGNLILPKEEKVKK
jgi:hypothetical protein